MPRAAAAIADDAVSVPRSGGRAPQQGQVSSPRVMASSPDLPVVTCGASSARHTHASQHTCAHGSKQTLMPSRPHFEHGGSFSLLPRRAASRAANALNLTTCSTAYTAAAEARPWPFLLVRSSTMEAWSESFSGPDCKDMRSERIAEAPAIKSAFTAEWRRRHAAYARIVT